MNWTETCWYIQHTRCSTGFNQTYVTMNRKKNWSEQSTIAHEVHNSSTYDRYRNLHTPIPQKVILKNKTKEHQHMVLREIHKNSGVMLLLVFRIRSGTCYWSPNKKTVHSATCLSQTEWIRWGRCDRGGRVRYVGSPNHQALGVGDPRKRIVYL